MQEITKIIRQRRSIFPNTYIDQPIPRELIEEILENANWAPNHRHTEPWRFKVFYSKSELEKLAQYLADAYKENTPAENFKQKKYEKTLKKATQSGCVVAICMQRDPAESVPEWEEVAAVSCAVQNMWLTCTAHNIGAYWSSPKYMTKRMAAEFLGLQEGEQCWGLFYMGYHNLPELPGKRKPISEKVEWR
ncbi:MAG: nitroreductase [Saprospiraceae bacterium]